MENQTLKIVNNAATMSAAIQFKIKGLKISVPEGALGKDSQAMNAELEEISFDVLLDAKTPTEIYTELGTTVLPNLLGLVTAMNEVGR